MEWPKKISVDKRIVQVLSGSTYENFPKALKELIINSYDADANNVDIKISRKNETIIISDDGKGLSEKDFDFYFRIAGKTREKERDVTQSGRNIIGQFGVGFLSLFPFCKQYYIESKKRNSAEVAFATIPCAKYLSRENKLIDVDEILIQGGKKIDNSLHNKQFTVIKLTGFTDLTKSFLFSEYSFSAGRDSILRYPGIERLTWELCEDLPLEYERNKINNLFKTDSSLPFNVSLNGVQLLRKVYGKNILDKNDNDFKQIGKMKFRYFIVTDYKSIKPPEARYLKIRNLNVGVGKRTTFGLGIETGGSRARLHHLTGEVHILEGMNDLIKVSRDDFNFSPDYEALKEFFRKKLSSLSNQLDDLADIEKIKKQTETEYRINNIALLDPKKIKQKILALKEKGYDVYSDDSKTKTDKAPIIIDKTKQEIIVDSDFSFFSRKINIKNKTYSVKVDAWDFKSDIYQACKIENDNIIINKSYPLFQKKKYTDVFIKLHLMLLINFKSNKIDKETFKYLLGDILKFYSDYI